jgi:hypothetical protein
MTNSLKLMRCLILASICFCLAPGQSRLEPTDQAVSLTGILRIAHGFGPPGYGEDKKVDIPISYWVLELPFKVTAACTPSRADLADIECGETNRIRLFFPAHPSDNDIEPRARKLRGHRAIVTGVLRRRDAIYQITPLYMDVADIQPVVVRKNSVRR